MERTKKIMKRENIDWLIATTPENVFYSIGFRSLGQWLMRSSKIEVLVLIPAQDPTRSVLISPAQELDVAAAIPPRVSKVCPVGHITIEPGDRSLWEEPDHRLAQWTLDTPSYTSVYHAVETLNLIQPNQRVALDDNLTYEGLREVLSPQTELFIAPEVIQDIRVIKTEEELELMRKGVQIAEEGLRQSMAALCTGISELELGHIYNTSVVKAGAVPYMTLVGIGSNGASPNHPSTNRQLRPNELIRWDVGCEVDGYRVDLGFIAFYGEPSPKVVKYADAIARAQTACFNAMQAGNKLSEVYQIGFDMMKAVIPAYKRKHLGHGVGVELREPPIIAPKEAQNERGVTFDRSKQATADLLELGMVIALEVLYYELGLGGFQIEDTIIVTEQGPVRLNKLPYELTVVPVKDKDHNKQEVINEALTK
ncbi:M24 family metallopeptidase [Microscilla marina]|nr:Xaa-Pro peptidase family protein [Microscilla marina]